MSQVINVRTNIDYLASYTTGAELIIDGGLVAR